MTIPIAWDSYSTSSTIAEPAARLKWCMGGWGRGLWMPSFGYFGMSIKLGSLLGLHIRQGRRVRLEEM